MDAYLHISYAAKLISNKLLVDHGYISCFELVFEWHSRLHGEHLNLCFVYLLLVHHCNQYSYNFTGTVEERLDV
jgi:hypothetical protein